MPLVITQTTHHIEDLAELWTRLYSANTQLTPFSDYGYCRCLLRTYRGNLISKMQRPHFIVLSRQQTDGTSEPVIIAPLAHSVKTRRWEIYGNLKGVGLTDFVYDPTVTADEMAEALQLVLRHTGQPVRFARLDERSVIMQAIQKHWPDTSVRDFKLVNIAFTDSYDDYFARLSQNTRQNIHKAQNRLRRDEAEWHLETYAPSSLNPHYNECLDTWVERQVSCYHQRLLGLKSMARFKLRHLKHDTISLRDLPNTLTAALRIRGSVAAVMFGLIDNTATRVYMPRVAIDPAFTYYSPGLLLCAETVRHLAAHTTIRNLDLTRGEERYKYTMGGAPYNTRYFTLQP